MAGHSFDKKQVEEKYRFWNKGYLFSIYMTVENYLTFPIMIFFFVKLDTFQIGIL